MCAGKRRCTIKDVPLFVNGIKGQYISPNYYKSFYTGFFCIKSSIKSSRRIVMSTVQKQHKKSPSEGGDFAAGKRELPKEQKGSDFARGKRILPKFDVVPDYARGERDLSPEDDDSDFAQGQHEAQQPLPHPQPTSSKETTA
jgi:hypothetical protein